jgi:hypothetical protein
MTLLVAMPDPLTWEAGMEYGIQALAHALAGADWTCAVAGRGPYLEATFFCAAQVGVRDHLVARNDVCSFADRADLLLFPRIVPMDRAPVLRAIGRERQDVITSDPAIRFSSARLRVVGPRDWPALAEAITCIYNDFRSR